MLGPSGTGTPGVELRTGIGQKWRRSTSASWERFANAQRRRWQPQAWVTWTSSAPRSCGHCSMPSSRAGISISQRAGSSPRTRATTRSRPRGTNPMRHSGCCPAALTLRCCTIAPEASMPPELLSAGRRIRLVTSFSASRRPRPTPCRVAATRSTVTPAFPSFRKPRPSDRTCPEQSAWLTRLICHARWTTTPRFPMMRWSSAASAMRPRTTPRWQVP